MANMFLDLDGIPGESRDHIYHDKIEVHDWVWGMDNDAPFDITGQDSAQQTRFMHLTIHKWLDQSSPTLMNFCVWGTKIDNGTLICRKNDGDKQLDYFKIHIKEIKVQKMDWPAKGGQEGAVVEIVDLSFHVVSAEYHRQKNKGDLAPDVPGKNDFGPFDNSDPSKTSGKL